MIVRDPGQPRTGKLALALLAILYSSGVLAGSGLGTEDATHHYFNHLAKEGFGAIVPVTGSTTTPIGSLPILTDQPLGSTRNSYAWSMAWFNNLLYVGTLRNQHCTIRPDASDPSCTLVNGTYPNADWRAEIWRFTPNTTSGKNPLNDGSWTRLFQSPYISNATLLNLAAGVPTTTPRDIGYRMMTVCNAGDGVDRLYVATAGIPANILYHNAGTSTFTATSTSGTYSTLQNLYNNTFDLSYRALTCFKGRLWASPTGTADDPDASLHPIVLMNPGPASGQAWQNVLNVQTAKPTSSKTLYAGANANNGGIFQMEAIGDYLYLAVGNRVDGLEIWRGNGTNCLPPWQGACTMTWERLIDHGAGRPYTGNVDNSGNPVVDNAGATLGVFGNDLYIGAGESGYFDMTNPELLRVNDANSANPTWELLVGWPRIGYVSGTSSSLLGSNFFCKIPGTVNPADPLLNKTCKDFSGAVIPCTTSYIKDLAVNDTTEQDCLPTSGYGPGMGIDSSVTPPVPSAYATGKVEYFWRFQEYKGEFFLGTLAGGNATYAGPNQDASPPVDASTPTPKKYCRGGFNRGSGAMLWNISTDNSYQLLFSDGFGNPQNNGLRTFAAMPYGLAIGTANYGYNDKPITGYKVYKKTESNGTDRACSPTTTPANYRCPQNLIGDPSFQVITDVAYLDLAAHTITGSETFTCDRVEGPNLRTDYAGYEVAGTNIIVGPNSIADSTPPTVSITFPVNKTSYTAAAFATGCSPSYNDICGTAFDNDAVFAVEVSVYNASTKRWLSGTTFNSTTQKWAKADIVKQDGATTYDWKYPLSLAAGTYNLSVRATDYAGKQTTATLSLTRK